MRICLACTALIVTVRAAPLFLLEVEHPTEAPANETETFMAELQTTPSSLEKHVANLIESSWNGERADIFNRLTRLRNTWVKQLAEEAAADQSPAVTYNPPTRTQIRSKGDNLYEVNTKLNVAQNFYQGDIQLTEFVFSQKNKHYKRRVEANAKHIETSTTPIRFGALPYTITLMLQPVCSSDISHALADDMVNAFKKAVHYWKTNTCINFEQSDTAIDRIRVFKGQGCYAYLGRIGGVQDISLGDGCETFGTAAHELGHALGFFHTQSRYDRDTAITVYVQNAAAAYADQFYKESRYRNDNYGLPYDLGSVMHYGATSASTNGEPTMVALDHFHQDTMGSDRVGFIDVLMMNTHYGCTAKCNSSTIQCANGGYPNPRNCNKCKCPSGFSGKLCQQRPTGCGSILYAQDTVQTYAQLLGDGTTTIHEDVSLCNFHIVAPNDTVIVMKITSLSAMCSDGCIYGGIEIKAKADFRLTGYRLCCSSSLNQEITSETNVVPLMLYNRFYQTSFVIDYYYVGLP